MEDREGFVVALGEVLSLAKPNLVKCHLHIFTKEELAANLELVYAHDARQNFLMAGDEYVIVTCANDYHYYVNVSGDSLAAIGEEVFKYMMNR